jgi:AcrR family transcriptional regulator
MSHTNVYKHFPSKISLQEAVGERWLDAISEPLLAIVQAEQPAAERLESWVLALAKAKHRKVHDDPELFATYTSLVADKRAVIERHLGHLRDQVAAIIRSGAVSGEFHVHDEAQAVAAVLAATIAFHHPQHVLADAGAPRFDEARRVVALLNAGLRAGAV